MKHLRIQNSTTLDDADEDHHHQFRFSTDLRGPSLQHFAKKLSLPSGLHLGGSGSHLALPHIKSSKSRSSQPQLLQQTEKPQKENSFQFGTAQDGTRLYSGMPIHHLLQNHATNSESRQRVKRQMRVLARFRREEELRMQQFRKQQLERLQDRRRSEAAQVKAQLKQMQTSRQARVSALTLDAQAFVGSGPPFDLQPWSPQGLYALPGGRGLQTTESGAVIL